MVARTYHFIDRATGIRIANEKRPYNGSTALRGVRGPESIQPQFKKDRFAGDGISAFWFPSASNSDMVNRFIRVRSGTRSKEIGRPKVPPHVVANHGHGRRII